VVLIALVFGVAVGHQFVFDDQTLVVDNELVQLPLSRAHELLLSPGPGVSYRPLRILSYMVDYRIAGGLDPATFHASSLVHHALVTIALYALAWLLLGSVPGALLAAALFAVHPLGSEAVVYVAGRRDQLSTLFVLLALLCWCRLLGAPHRPHDPPRARRGRSSLVRGLLVALMVACAILGVAAKEMVVVLPVLALLLAVPLRAAAQRGGDTSHAWTALGATAVALVAVGIWLYSDTLGSALAKVGGEALAPQPALSLRVVGRYLLLAAWPGPLLADYRAHAFALPTAAIDGPSLVAALALSAVVVTGAVLWLRGSMVGAGLLWFVVALLPVAQIVPYSEVVSEHNAYLALAGLALAAAALATAAARTRPRLVAVVAVALIMVLGVRSHVRALDWRDSLSLWRATVATAPGSIRGQFNLGIAMVAEGDLVGAKPVLERAHELAPDDRDILLTLATLEGRLGGFERAEELARRAIALRRDGRAFTALGWAQVSQGNSSAAAESFETAIALGDDGFDARRGLARARGRGGKL
jgi:protein O-mannosyl-transferase